MSGARWAHECVWYDWPSLTRPDDMNSLCAHLWVPHSCPRRWVRYASHNVTRTACEKRASHDCYLGKCKFPSYIHWIHPTLSSAVTCLRLLTNLFFLKYLTPFFRKIRKTLPLLPPQSPLWAPKFLGDLRKWHCRSETIWFHMPKWDVKFGQFLLF